MMFGFAFFLHNFATQKTETMSIERNKAKLPVRCWFKQLSEYNMFSSEYKKTRHDSVEWCILLDHAKRMEDSCQHLNASIYPSRLFMAYVDILEANLYVFNDLYYYITGEQLSDNLYSQTYIYRPFDFWDMEYYKEIGQIHERIAGTEAYLMNCLNQGSLQAIYNEVVARTGWYADHKPNFPPQSIHEKRAYGFVRQTYAEPVADENALIVQLVRIQHFLTAFKYIFSSPNFGPECFPWLLDNFCKSQVCKELIANWSHDLSGSRKDLESAIKESDELSRWWPKVKNCPPHAIYGALDFVSEDERHNTENWVQILKIYALLAEYDECHSETAEEIAPEPTRDESALVRRLRPLLNSDQDAANFAKRFDDLSAKKITDLVNQLWAKGVIADTTTKKDLWEVLHDFGIYTPKLNNWNGQVTKPKPKR